jgi:hypothetical protein
MRHGHWVDGNDRRTVDLDRDALMDKVDRQDQQSSIRAAPDQDAFDTREWPFIDADALALAQVWVRKNRQFAADDLVQRFDLFIRDRREAVPPLAEDPHHPFRLEDVEVAGFVDGVLEEQVPWKHRSRNQTLRPRPSRPAANRGKECTESLRVQLVVHELLTVTVRPDCKPLWYRQGFAPFGSMRFFEIEPGPSRADIAWKGVTPHHRAA